MDPEDIDEDFEISDDDLPEEDDDGDDDFDDEIAEAELEDES